MWARGNEGSTAGARRFPGAGVGPGCWSKDVSLRRKPHRCRERLCRRPVRLTAAQCTLGRIRGWEGTPRSHRRKSAPWCGGRACEVCRAAPPRRASTRGQRCDLNLRGVACQPRLSDAEETRAARSGRKAKAYPSAQAGPTSARTRRLTQPTVTSLARGLDVETRCRPGGSSRGPSPPVYSVFSLCAHKDHRVS